MATKLELFNQLKIDIAAGKGLSDDLHLVNHTQERKRRKENKKQTTRFSRETCSPQSYSELSEQWDRYIVIAVDPSIGVQNVIRALAQVSDETLREWIFGPVEPAKTGVPKANIPAWLED